MSDGEFLHQLKLQKRLFKDERDEISRNNISVLVSVSFTTLLLYAMIMIGAPYVLTKWVPTWHYYAFIPLILGFLIFSYYLYDKENYNFYLVHTLCIIYYFVITFWLTIIDCIPYPETREMFFPLIIIIFPLLFIFRYYVYVLLTILLEAINIGLIRMNKMGELISEDIFQSLVASFLALAVAWIILVIRSKEKDEKQKLRQLSTTDQLTGLLNKVSSEKLTTDFLRQRPAEGLCALLIIDVDNFKKVNDGYGHHVGDVALIQFGALLRDTFRVSDIVGRIGGDEFMIMIRHIPNISVIEKKCQEIEKSIRQVKIADGLKLTCSIGVCIAGKEFITFHEMFQYADVTLYEVKNAGKGDYSIYKTPIVKEME